MKTIHYWQRVDGIGYWWCYMVSNLVAMSNSTGKVIPTELYKSFLKEMLAKGHDPKQGKFYLHWPLETIPWRKKNMGDTFFVKKEKRGSDEFWRLIDKWIPCVCSIDCPPEYKEDRKDKKLDTLIYPEWWVGHTITFMKVDQKYLFLESVWTWDTYEVSKDYINNTNLFGSSTVLFFIKKPWLRTRSLKTNG